MRLTLESPVKQKLQSTGQEKKMAWGKTFSRLNSQSILNFGNVMKEEAFSFSQSWGCGFRGWMGFVSEYKAV